MSSKKGLILFVPLVVLIYFFDRFLLPFGLTFSVLLVPFFVFSCSKIEWTPFKVLPYLCLSFFVILHFFQGVHFKAYLISFAVFLAALIFAHIFYESIKNSTGIESLLHKLIKINAGLVLLALAVLSVDGLRAYMWWEEPFTNGYAVIPRLKLFHAEASHYGLALLPLIGFVVLDLIQKNRRKQWFHFLIIIASLILSFSIGIWAVAFMSIVLVFILKFKTLSNFPIFKKLFLGGFFSFLVLGLVLYLFFPDNPLYFRLEKIFAGEDTSGNGRTFEAFNLAITVLGDQMWLGKGLGQFKIIGREALLSYYQYINIPENVRLPNAMAETLVSFGIVGAILRGSIQVFLFFKCKVFSNELQLFLFIALFIYQFTGSFLSNTMEMALWVLAFVPIYTMNFAKTEKTSHHITNPPNH